MRGWRIRAKVKISLTDRQSGRKNIDASNQKTLNISHDNRSTPSQDRSKKKNNNKQKMQNAEFQAVFNVLVSRSFFEEMTALE